MSQVETRPTTASETARAVQLIDCDVHAQATEAMLARYLSPAARRMLERYGRRTPRVTEWYPRVRHSGMRVDAWPGKPGHIWGSDPELTREQLLDEFDVDYAVLEVLSGQDCYDHPDFAAEWNTAVNQWQLDEWLGFDPQVPRDDRGASRVPGARGRRDRAARRRRPVPGRAAAGERGRAARRAEILADLRGRDRARPPGGVPHRRLRRSPRRRISVVLPRVPRRQRDRHAEPAREHGRRRHVRRDPGAAGGADRVRRGLGRGAALVARRRLGADARGSSAPRSASRRSTSTSTCGSRHSRSRSPTTRSTWSTRSSRRGWATGCCSRPTIRTGTSTRPSRRCHGRSGPNCGGRSCARTRSRCTDCRAERPGLMDAIDCDVHCRAGVL